MWSNRAMKRIRAEESSFWNDGKEKDAGEYLKVSLTSGKPIKGKGWPWVQQCIRGIIGEDKVEKANFAGEGKLLVKTKNNTQTEKLIKATMFGDEQCSIERDNKLNQSKGTIYATDLVELTEDEVVGWLKKFGVVAAKRFTKNIEGRTEKTPTILLTFNKPNCPDKLEYDYVVYRVEKYVPNPLICHRCGKYGHHEVGCGKERICLRCGDSKHDGSCDLKCSNCKIVGHCCLSRQCSWWKSEKEICQIKVDRDVSFAHARHIHKQEQRTPSSLSYANMVRSPSEGISRETRDTASLRGRVESVESKLDKVMTLLEKLLQLQLSKETAGASEQTKGQLSTTKSSTQPEIVTDSHDKEHEKVVGINTPLPTTQLTEPSTQSSEQHMGNDSLSDMEENESQTQPDHSQEMGQTIPSEPQWSMAGPTKKGGGNKSKKGRTDDSQVIVSPHVGSKNQTGLDQAQGKRMPNLTRMAFIPESPDT